MASAESESRPFSQPPQTIVIERPAKKGCLGRALLLVLVFALGAALFSNLFQAESGLFPSKLTEKYFAGDLSLTADKIAIVEVDGPIFSSMVDNVLKQLQQARDDKHVKAVVLRVDSPGGTVSGSDRIWRDVSMLGMKKPVVASFGGTAASGGYYVAAPAVAIFAEPTTMTGSIGVIAEFPHFEELMKKVGVNLETITSGQWKDSGSMFRPMTEEERKRWGELIDNSYERFVRIVAQGRGLPLEKVKEIANGKVYTADEARKLSLVTSIGYLEDAIADAQKRASLKSARVIRYSRPINLRETLIGLSAPQRGIQIDQATLMQMQVPRILFLAR